MQQTASHLQAASFALLGYTLWVLCDVCLKYAGASPMPAVEVIAVVGLLSALLVALPSVGRGELRALWPKQPLPQAARAMLDLGNNVGVLIALQHLPLAMFYIVIFLCPLVSALLAMAWLHEALRWQQVMALLVGFAGVVVAVDPFRKGHVGDGVGYLACLVCVACFSANLVWSRKMTQTETKRSMAFVSGIAIALAGGVVSVLLRGSTAVAHSLLQSPRMWGALTATALFGVVGNLCMFMALRHAPTALVSQFHYSQLPAGALVGYLFWRERPTTAMVMGAVLIVAAGAYIARRSAVPRASVSPADAATLPG